MTLLDTIGIIANVGGAISAFVGACGVIKLLKNARSSNEEIKVYLKADGQEPRLLPVFLRRRDLTRAELLGRIGMLPMKESGAPRFDLKALLATREFFEDLNALMEGKGNALEIAATPDEIDQFDWERLEASPSAASSR
jgi:hypothetical protein